mmetsp:Transcript_5726/g.16111  ORF Transcript_5726/g.16111 Transcript_5726/m.16111 type:complete len:120 (+) Transcript_5726:1212-1571(+)
MFIEKQTNMPPTEHISGTQTAAEERQSLRCIHRKEISKVVTDFLACSPSPADVNFEDGAGTILFARVLGQYRCFASIVTPVPIARPHRHSMLSPHQSHSSLVVAHLSSDRHRRLFSIRK